MDLNRQQHKQAIGKTKIRDMKPEDIDKYNQYIEDTMPRIIYPKPVALSIHYYMTGEKLPALRIR